MNNEMKPSERVALRVLLGVFLLLLFVELPGSHLFDPDEARYAEIPREMLASGNFLKMELNGSDYLEKPPLLYWANALSMKALGETPFAARLPVRLACTGTVLLLICAEGLWPALLYISCLLPFALGRINIIDGLVSFFITAAFFSLRSLLRAESLQKTRRQALLLGTSVAFGVLAKGLIAIVLPGLVFAAWVAITKQWSALRKVLVGWAPIIFFALVVPVVLLLETNNPGFFHFFVVREHFQRYLSDIHERTQPWWFFVPVVMLGLLPWPMLIIANIRSAFRKGWRDLRTQSDLLFLGLWAVVPFCFFSLSHSKLIPYILPIFVPLSILMARPILSADSLSNAAWKYQAIFFSLIGIGGFFAARHASAVVRLDLFGPVAMLSGIFVAAGWVGYMMARRSTVQACLTQTALWSVSVGVLVGVVPKLAHDYSDHALAVAAKEAGTPRIFMVRDYSQNFPWVLQRPVPVVGFKGELASNGELDPKLFWSESDFWRLWQGPEKVVVVTRGRDISEFATPTGLPVRLASNRRRTVLLNHN